MKVVIFDDELSKPGVMSAHPGPVAGKPSARQPPPIEIACWPHADESVAIVERERPDVVLMDYTMHAERSGAEAVAALHVLREHGGPQFLLVAISADEAANQRMLDAGADDAVPKTHVRGYLQKLLEQQRLSRSEIRG
jgi:CheY-like chemotaxis protein